MISTRLPLRLALAAALTSAAAACFREPPPNTVPDATRPDGTPLVRTDTGPRPTVIQRDGPELVAPAFIALTADFVPVRVETSDGIFVNPTLARNMTSLEGSWLPLTGRGVGFAGRAIVGGGKGPIYTEANLLLGSREGAVDLGLGTRRAFNVQTGGTYDSVYTIFKLGARSRYNIGRTPWSLQGRLAKYFNLPEGGQGNPSNFRGWHAEGGVSWTMPNGRAPFTANLGYRRESIRLYDRKQDLSAVFFGAGLLIGRLPPDTTRRTSSGGR